MCQVYYCQNFVTSFVWQSKKGGGSDSNSIVVDHEYVVCYVRSQQENPLSKILLEAESLDKTDDKGPYRRGRELNKWGSNSRREDRPTMWFPIPGPEGIDVYPIRNDGTEGCWRWGKKNMLDIVTRGDVEFEKRPNGTYIAYEKIRSTDPRQKPFRSWLNEVGTTADGSKAIKELFDDKKVFDFPKPLALIKQLLTIGSGKDDEEIILDFFCGSGTTAHAVLAINAEDGVNRRFLCVQLPEKTSEESVAFQAGYSNIARIAKDRIRKVCEKMQADRLKQEDLFSGETPDLGFKVFKLRESNFKSWRGDLAETEGELAEQLDMFVDTLRPEAQEENVAYELMLKSGFELTTPIKRQTKGTTDYWSINDGEVLLLLSSLNEELIDAVIASRPQKVICLDSLFHGDDQLKTNTALAMKDAGIPFEVV